MSGRQEALRPSLCAAGMIIWLGSETMFFGGLFAAYFTLRAHTAGWHEQGAELNKGLGAVFTLVLLASSWTMHLAVAAARRRRFRAVTGWTAASAVLGAAFVANQAREWAGLGFGVSSHPFGSAFYVMTGFHGLHLLAGIAGMALLMARIRLAGAADQDAVEALSFYWHFVDLVWIALFGVLFILR